MKRIILMITMMLCLASTASALGAVSATFLSQDPDPVEPGEYTELRWRIENVGSFDLSDIKFSIDENYPFRFDSEVDRVKTVGSLGASLESDKAIVLKFRVKIDENAVTGDNDVTLRVEFPDGSEKIERTTIDIESRELLLSVSEVELHPERPKPGEFGNALVTVTNLEDVTAEDVNVKLNLQGMPVATVGGTNEQYVKRLVGGASHTFNFSLAVGADARSQLYQIPVEISYSDKFNRQYNSTSAFGCAVEAPPEYIVNIDKSDIVVPNTHGSIVVSVSNIGASDINYVTVELAPGNNIEVLSNPLVYMGNLESDDYETAEYKVYVKEQTGDLSLPVKLTYKDSYNQNVEEEVDLSLKVYSEADAVKFGLKPARSMTGTIVFLLVLVGGGYYWYRRKRKK